MIDLDYLKYLEGFLTENRKERFEKVLANRTNLLRKKPLWNPLPSALQVLAYWTL